MEEIGGLYGIGRIGFDRTNISVVCTLHFEFRWKTNCAYHINTTYRLAYIQGALCFLVIKAEIDWMKMSAKPVYCIFDFIFTVAAAEVLLLLFFFVCSISVLHNLNTFHTIISFSSCFVPVLLLLLLWALLPPDCIYRLVYSCIWNVKCVNNHFLCLAMRTLQTPVHFHTYIIRCRV